MRMLVAVLLLGIVAPAAAQAPAPAWRSPGTVAFVGVNVIPMDRETTLRDQTVVVQGGRITAVGPRAETDVPSGAVQVDGAGRWLMPGLAEMHGHVPSQPGQFQDDVLFLYVAAGATTVRGMQGHPNHLPMRERVRSGEVVGPHLYLSSPPLAGMGGQAVSDVETARERVRAAKAAGYDHLKVHEGLSPAVYEAIATTAHAEGIPFGGHVSDVVGLEAALAARQTTIDHLDNYIDAIQADDSPALALSGAERTMALPLHVDRSKIAEVAQATRAAGVGVVPTMALWEVLRGGFSGAMLRDLPELRYMPRAMVAQWASTVDNIHSQYDPRAAEAEMQVRREILGALNDAGVEILMGTDAPQLFSVPGFSLKRELEVMVASGMTPWEVLRTGTVAVAEHYDLEAGTVTVGNRADLLLLSADPLSDIANVERVEGVMVEGRWLGPEARAAGLEAIATRAAAGQ